jgi:ribosomal protein L19E
MAKEISMSEKISASTAFEVIKNRVKIEALLKTLADAGVIDKEDYVKNYNEIYEQKHEQYAAEILDLTTEDFKKMVEPK